MSNYTQKQIANWRRIRINIESELNKLHKAEEELKILQHKIEELHNSIDIQEYPVKKATGGYTSQDIFVKEWLVNDKVSVNGKTVRKAIYNLRYPDTIVPPADNDCGMKAPENQEATNVVVNESNENYEQEEL